MVSSEVRVNSSSTFDHVRLPPSVPLRDGALPSVWMRIAPPVAALFYPALVWSGPALWSPLLATALLVPLLAAWVLLRTQGGAAAGVALVAIGAPPLFTVIGALLDFQTALPVRGIHVWIALWLALTAVAARPPRAASAAPANHATRRLAVAHGIAAFPMIAFGLAHLTNHLGGVVSGETHIAMTTALRTVYREPIVEAVLLASIAFQVGSGAVLCARRLRSNRVLSALEGLQIAAGAYLMFFFASHLTAVLRARSRGTNTDWAWLVKFDIIRDPWCARLAPYYFLSVIAFALHLACAVRVVAAGHCIPVLRSPRFVAAVTALAVVASAAIMFALQR